MTFLVCLPVEVLIPVSENTEEYSVRILYLYGYKGTFPHSYHTDTETSLCFISPETERVHRFFVELHQLSRGSKYTCFCEVKLKTVELWNYPVQSRNPVPLPEVLNCTFTASR